jgi:hypothetical protein
MKPENSIAPVPRFCVNLTSVRDNDEGMFLYTDNTDFADSFTLFYRKNPCSLVKSGPNFLIPNSG